MMAAHEPKPDQVSLVAQASPHLGNRRIYRRLCRAVDYLA